MSEWLQLHYTLFIDFKRHKHILLHACLYINNGIFVYLLLNNVIVSVELREWTLILV